MTLRARRSMKLTLRLLVATLVLLAASAAQAQFSVQKFLPGTHAFDYLSITSARVNGHLKPNAALIFNVATRPLAFEMEGEDLTQSFIEQLYMVNLVGSISLYEFVEIGLDVPMAVVNGVGGASIVSVNEPPSFSMGDLRLTSKVSFLPRVDEGIGLAMQLELTAPTGADDSFVSEANVTFTPKLVLEYNLDDYLVALNVGYRLRENSTLDFLDINDELLLGLGANIPVWERHAFVLAEVQGATDAVDFFGTRNTRYLEGLLGAKWVFDMGLYATVAGGTGVLRGVGNPSMRVIASVGWSPDMYKPADEDGDGIVDKVDVCPSRPEDKDGYKDGDGCPDPDNDGDGVLDHADKCPIRAEDRDGYKDDDGCPDEDNDGDGLADGVDKCPNEKEDEDGYKDKDGCPEPDNDSDGFLDGEDKCPLEPENVNQYKDDDGCPDTPPIVYVTKEKIVITQKIFFQKGTAKILKKSQPVLNAVADILKKNPQIELISIEGHTSSEGSKKGNQRLSHWRAGAVVMFLTKHGIGYQRVKYKGWGSAKPLTELPEKTEEEREKNRRVEFIILKQK